MAIKDENSNATADTGADMQSSAGNAFQREAPKAEFRRSNVFAGNGSMFGSPISKGIGSEYTNKLVNELNELFKNNESAFESNILVLDNQIEVGLVFSTILLAMRYEGTPGLVVAIPLLLAATGEKVLPIIENVNNVNIEIVRTPGSGLDTAFSKKAMEKMSKAFPNMKVEIIDGMVVHNTFDINSKEAIHYLAWNAALACGTELRIKESGFADFTIKDVGPDTTLALNVSFNNPDAKDAVGEPVRSDIGVRFISQRTSNVRSASINTEDQDQVLTEITGFMDLIWNPAMGPSGGDIYRQYNERPMTQKYSPRFIMTNLASNFAYTPSVILLALSNAFSLARDSNWVQAFRSTAPMGTHGKKAAQNINIRDIGAMNIEANLFGETDKAGYGSPVDTTAATFDLLALGKYLTDLIQPGLILSLDCPEAGQNSWALSCFPAAEAGHQGAIQHIIKAAMSLTGGAFGKYFNGSTDSIFTDVNNRVHMGHYRDSQGDLRDIRNIDTIAIANIMGRANDPVRIADFQDTFLRTDIDLSIRLANRLKIIQAATNENAEVTGFARRVTFTDKFMSALASAIVDAGLSARVITPISSAEFQNTRGVATYAQAAGVTSNQAGFLHSGYGSRQTLNSNYGMGGQNRW